MDSCCISSGGIVRISLAGQIVKVRGSVTINETNLDIKEGANIDQSVYTTSEPVPPSIEATLSDGCDVSISDLMKVRCTDITAELPEVGRTYILTGGTIAGRPSLDPSTGEISGVKFVGSQMRAIKI
jgi:hypothetical protein